MGSLEKPSSRRGSGAQEPADSSCQGIGPSAHQDLRGYKPSGFPSSSDVDARRELGTAALGSRCVLVRSPEPEGRGLPNRLIPPL